MTSEELTGLLSKTTPGPWIPLGDPQAGFMHVKCRPSALVRGFTKVVCAMDVYDAGIPEKDANARLIALAPQLAAEVLVLRARNARLVGALRGFVAAYDNANHVRMGDFHRDICTCLRCQRDRAAALSEDQKEGGE